MEAEPKQPDKEPSVGTSLSSRSRIVSAAHSPLGFFVLALLIVEGFLVGGGALFGLSEGWKIASLCVGVILFLAVFGTVVWLVVRYPQNLVFGEESHVQYAAMKIYGTEKHKISGRTLDTLPQASAPEPPTGQLASDLKGDD